VDTVGLHEKKTPSVALSASAGIGKKKKKRLQMAKHALYFSHDSNARTDEKIVDLRMCLGWEGYGIYWAIVEMLSESTDYVMDINHKRIAFALNTNEDIIEDIITNYNLFNIEGSIFGSESLSRRMELKDKRAEKARKGANARWKKQGDRLKSTGEIRKDVPQVYVIICEGEGERFVKVGITTEYISRRYSGKIPYKYEVYAQFFTHNYLSVESELNAILKQYSYSPSRFFDGVKECYTMESLEKIVSFSSSFAIESMHVSEKSYCIADASHKPSNAINKEINKEINKTIKKETKKPSEKALQLSHLLFDKMLMNNPMAKKPNFDTWGKHVDLMLNRDKLNYEQIEYLINFSQHDHFWQQNILSTKKLRDKKDQLILKAKAEDKPKSKSDASDEVLARWSKKIEMEKQNGRDNNQNIAVIKTRV
jgi:hypothetical protein